ncbi:hypothetical protein OIE66_00210 [Nonomuraea sp. NBC_01738]|uniref:hypothetical protein n=1 Tax=Nonomuraea sp. NBC_01738 TaxID=2976003 RepID=UPI002E115813|nr:hypothetical protein OIE66_00210 [Nonomuraea sp. NBC_01738]
MYGHPSPYDGASDRVKTHAIVALVMNLVAVVSCCNVLGLPGAGLSWLALRCSGDNPGKARRLLVWAWVVFGSGFALSVSLFLYLGLTGAFED